MRNPKTIAFWTGKLPHWEVQEGRYFVTIHLAGAIPRAAQQRILEIAAALKPLGNSQHDERLRIQRQIFVEMERWLDTVEHATHLEKPENAEIVKEAINHRCTNGVWRVFEYVVMPSHIHIFFELQGVGLKAVLENFKGWTARRIATRTGLNQNRFWQREWFDHWSRSDEYDERIVAYIRRNPVKAGLVNDYRDWPHGSWTEVGPGRRTGPQTTVTNPNTETV